MDKYKKACIYGIRCNTTNELYIGSTYNKLNVRLGKHLTDMRGYLCINKKHRNYRRAFEVLFNDNYEIFKIEDWPCNNREELHMREGMYIYKYWKEIVNKRLPVRREVLEKHLNHSFSLI